MPFVPYLSINNGKGLACPRNQTDYCITDSRNPGAKSSTDHYDPRDKPTTGASNEGHSLQRWLQEGDVEAARQRGDREGYARGKEGMAEYLKDWEKNWERLETQRGNHR